MVKIKFVFEAYRMDADDPIRRVTEKSQVAFELDAFVVAHPHLVDEAARTVALQIERRLRDDLRKALGLPSRRDRVEIEAAT